jgi:hypothetical protein
MDTIKTPHFIVDQYGNIELNTDSYLKNYANTLFAGQGRIYLVHIEIKPTIKKALSDYGIQYRTVASAKEDRMIAEEYIQPFGDFYDLLKKEYGHLRTLVEVGIAIGIYESEDLPF